MHRKDNCPMCDSYAISNTADSVGYACGCLIRRNLSGTWGEVYEPCRAGITEIRRLKAQNAYLLYQAREIGALLGKYSGLNPVINCAEEFSVPTKRQQVAEHLLTRLQEMRACQILRVAVSDLAEGEYDVSARLVMQVVNIIEEAAREEQDA